MFCVECGEEGNIYKNGVCINCYLKTHSFTKGPKVIDLPVCNHCNSFKYKNTWTDELLNDVLRRIIKHKFTISKELEKIDINPVCKETKEGLECKVYISGVIEKTEVNEEHDLLVRLKRTVCDVCSKRFGGYHEAIIQVRTTDRKLTNEELSNIQLSVENHVQTLQAKGNRSLFITDVGIEHTGLDFFISDKGAALVITKKLQEEYGGKVKQSSKNIGMKDSKQIHRMTYLLRLPSYNKGDLIEINNQYFQILSIQGNSLKIINLSNWDVSNVDIKSIEKSKILKGNELTKEMILVSQTDTEIQVMDLKSYKTIELKKPKNKKFKSKNINIIKIGNQLFIDYKN